MPSRGAHENPFRTSRLLSLPAEWDVDVAPEALLARWRANGRRGAFVGPHGTGKSRRLDALARRIAAEEYVPTVRLRWLEDGAAEPAEWRSLLRDAIRARALVCIDGLENLGATGRLELRLRLRAAAGALATLHAPRAGWPVLARHAPDADLFSRHVRTIAPDLAESEARAAFAASGRNAHEAFRLLYLAWSRQGAITA